MHQDLIDNPSYRYTLHREVNPDSEKTLCWVMLNPSTADEFVDDPTIRRVKDFTLRGGYRDLVVVNLFAARSTQPKHLLEMADPVGPRNEETIQSVFADADDVVFAWGSWHSSNNAKRYGIGVPRLNVERLARFARHQPFCLGVTKDGSPRHPLYVSAITPMQEYR